jgi:hypothetical protein
MLPSVDMIDLVVGQQPSAIRVYFLNVTAAQAASLAPAPRPQSRGATVFSFATAKLLLLMLPCPAADGR